MRQWLPWFLMEWWRSGRDDEVLSAGLKRKRQSGGLRVAATCIGRRSWRSASSDRALGQSMRTRDSLWRCNWRC